MYSVVIMGVAGCGKSSVGQRLASTLRLPLIEGDAFHPKQNVEKMRNGQALSDADRADWLSALGLELSTYPAGAVLTCSALRRSYRDSLRKHSPGLCFVFLDINPETALLRVTARAGEHLFPPSLVSSQFATLESPVGEPRVLRIDAALPIETITSTTTQWLDTAFAKDTV